MVACGICALLVLAVALVFGQAVRAQFLNYDDDQYIYYTPQVTKGLTLDGTAWAFTHRHAHNRHPLTTLSHMLDCQLYGLKPAGHHLTNIVLHTATVVLLFLVLYSMTSKLWLSAIVAAVFALHPLRAESVAWVSERKDVLSGVFFMLTLAAYARYARRPFSWHRYLLVVVLFGLGLMCKPTIVTLPFLLLLLDYWPLGRLAEAKRPILEKLPMIAMTAIWCAVTLSTQRVAVEALAHLSLGSRVANAIVSYAAYLGKLLYPAGLIPFYPHPLDTLPATTVAACALLLATISAVAFACRKRHPYLLVGWLWYLGSLVPVVGIIQAGEQALADRYTYLTQIGILIALVWGIASLLPARPYCRTIGGLTAGAVIIGLMTATSIQVSYWRDSRTLWTRTLKICPQNYIAQLNLGNALYQEGRTDDAIEQFRLAVKVNPNHAVAHCNLGESLHHRNEDQEAIQEFERALKIDPELVQGHYCLGNVLAQRGQFEAAIAHFRKALEINPNFALPLNNLGNALDSIGKVDEAIDCYHEAIRRQPESVDAYFNLGNVLAQKKSQFEEAIRLWHKVLKLSPGHAKAHLHLGLVFNHQHRRDEAISEFRQALQLDPQLAQARHQLAALGVPTEAPSTPSSPLPSAR
jgi:tetratricopeptide (TPR) repeat protein